MTWVPIVSSKRNSYCKTRGSSAITAIIISLLVFGLLSFIFFNRFNGFSIPIWIIFGGMGVLLVFIVMISIFAATMSGQYQKPKYTSFNSQKSQLQTQNQRANPYIVQRSTEKQPEEVFYKEVKRDIPVMSDINYCRFCGAKVDRDATFCHQCGINLSS